MKTIDREQLAERKNSIDDVTLINTLPEEQFAESNIDGSINVPLTKPDFVERVSAAVLHRKEAEIIVYCASRECDSSTRAAEKLESAGFTNVYDYAGGAKEWQEATSSEK